MNPEIAVYNVKVTVRSGSSQVQPPILSDLELIIEGGVENYLTKQHDGIDHALIEVNATAERVDE